MEGCLASIAWSTYLYGKRRDPAFIPKESIDMKRLLDARHRWRCLTSLLVALLTASHVPAQLVDPAPNAWTPSSVQHVTVYGTAGRFAGWPANHGAWSWGNEILVGFSLGYHKDLGKKGTISIAISPRHIFLLEASMEESPGRSNIHRNGVVLLPPEKLCTVSKTHSFAKKNGATCRLAFVSITPISL